MIDSSWLRCPNCFRDLEEVSTGVLGCSCRHRYDVARQGYVTLLPPRAPRTIGDDAAMLEQRAALLDSGLYSPIADALAAAAASAPTDAALRRGSARSHHNVVDFGCGTGYYSRIVAANLRGIDTSASFLVADRSPLAVRRAIRAVDATGVVLDIWRALPLRGATADIVLNIFAPRNPGEFARVLRPGGRLLVVVPTDEHLHELQTGGHLLDVPAGKADRVAAQMGAVGLELAKQQRVSFRAETTDTIRAQLIGMGPSAHHHSADAGSAENTRVAPQPERVTVSVDVLTFQRR